LEQLCPLESEQPNLEEDYNEKHDNQRKYLLTIREAGEYFSIGVKKMRRLAEDNLEVFSVYSGNRYLIIRTKFEEYLCNTSTI
jgi:excisionase family DNA binding protein